MKTTTHNQNRAALLPLAILASVFACSQQQAIPCPPGLSDVCYSGAKGTAGIGLCRVGVRLCFEHNGEIVERCEGEVVPAAEICDRADNDCNGASDENGVCNAGITTELEHHLDDLESRTGPLWAFTRPGRTGPTLLTRQHWAPVFRCEETAAARQCADTFLRTEANALGIGNPQTDLEFSDEMALSPDSAATVIVRYRQVHAGHPVQSGGVTVRVRDHKVTVAEVYNVPILPGAATAAAISDADVLNNLPDGAVVLGNTTLQYAPNDLQSPLEGQTHILAYLIVYARPTGEVYERVVDATDGTVIRDADTTVDNALVLTVTDNTTTPPTTFNTAPAQAGDVQTVWNDVTDTYNFVNGMTVGFTANAPVTLVENPNITDSHEYRATITNLTGICGSATPCTRTFRVGSGCIGGLSTEHEALHVTYDPYLDANYAVAAEEAIDHALVDIGSLLIECDRVLAAGATNCNWQTNYSNGANNNISANYPQAYTDAANDFDAQGYAAAVRITDDNWIDPNELNPGDSLQADTINKLLFGAPIVRTLIRWGVSQENIRRLQYLMHTAAYTANPGGWIPTGSNITNMSIAEFARHMIGICYGASDDALWGLNRERCATLQSMFDTANVASFCELFSEEEFCNGVDDNCDGYIDNCLGWEDCCEWRHLNASVCDADVQRRRDSSLTSWCYDGSAETAGIGVCRAGFRTCDPVGMNSASWSDACNDQAAPTQEVCDTPAAPAAARDENCNGVVNEDAVRIPCVFDADGDGVHGTGPVSMRCACSGRWLEESVVVDCNDSDASVFPRVGDFDEGTNALCNSVDDDCDGILDEGCPCNPLVNLPRPCGPESDIGPLCIAGVQRCMWDPAARQNRWTEECFGDEWGSPEICNGVDDDCDGLTDNDDPQGMVDIHPADACMDRSYPVPCLGHFECSDGRRICRGEPRPEVCNGLDDNCNGVADDGFAGQPESCDNADNNCNGLVDEELVRDCSNLCGAGTEFCSAGSWARCTAPTPSAEICNGRDDDCDGTVDNGTCTTCVGLDDLTSNGDAFLTLTRGDREFGGNGPTVTVTVSLSSSGRSICAEVTTTMEETRSDWSTGVNTRTTCSDAPGTVLEILTPPYSASYTDTDNNDWERSVLPPSGVVTQVDCVGDTGGNDICADSPPPGCSLCYVYLGCVEVRYRYE